MSDPLVVGVLYPGEWNADFDQHMGELAAVDPRVEIVVEPYEEPSELRCGRGVPPYDALRHLAPPLSAAQRAALARIECCVALDLPFEVAAVAPRLRWVHALGAGVAQLESAGLREAGIRLTNTSGANATSIAEFVLARILGEFKQVRRLDATQQRKQWLPVYGEAITHKTVGLIGFGPINQAVARRARAFDLEVSASDPSTRQWPAVPSSCAAARPGPSWPTRWWDPTGSTTCSVAATSSSRPSPSLPRPTSSSTPQPSRPCGRARCS